MLVSEFVEMGGKVEDYTAANDIYTELDLWLDRHEFFIWWCRFGGESLKYEELLEAMRTAERAQDIMPGLFTLREIMLRHAEAEAEKKRNEIKRLEQQLEGLKGISLELNKNRDLFNR